MFHPGDDVCEFTRVVVARLEMTFGKVELGHEVVVVVGFSVIKVETVGQGTRLVEYVVLQIAPPEVEHGVPPIRLLLQNLFVLLDKRYVPLGADLIEREQVMLVSA